jgi:hypothetical protein
MAVASHADPSMRVTAPSRKYARPLTRLPPGTVAARTCPSETLMSIRSNHSRALVFRLNAEAQGDRDNGSSHRAKVRTDRGEGREVIAVRVRGCRTST